VYKLPIIYWQWVKDLQWFFKQSINFVSMNKLSFLTCLFCVISFSVVAQPGTNNPDRVYTRKVKTDDLQNKNEVYYFDGKPYTGLSYDEFDNRTKMQEINWKDGLLHGTKTEYFIGGVGVRGKLNFYEGKRQGPFVYYHDNGQINIRGNYYLDALDSTVEAFFNNGKPQYVHHYNKGTRIGESITYYKNGNVEQELILKNEKPHGLMTTYYEAGNIRQKGHYDEGVRDGQFIRYHLTGVMAEESYYKNGFQDSLSRYWDNVFGALLKEEFYKDGKRDGTWLTYNENGDTLTLFTYKNDLKNGPYIKYFAGVTTDANSNKQYVRQIDEYGNYVDGKLDGEFKTGLYNRAAHAEGTYSMGAQVGEWKYWDEKDKLVLHEKYNEDGELIYQKPKLQIYKDDE
jgi:antitoxin component YwqK of YwqJK toxin-antitoxin module